MSVVKTKQEIKRAVGTQYKIIIHNNAKKQKPSEAPSIPNE